MANKCGLKETSCICETLRPPIWPFYENYDLDI